MHKIIIPGLRDDAPPRPTDSDTGTLIATFRIAASRSAAAKRHEVDLPDDHLVEVELENGLTLWRRAEQLRGEGTSRGTSDDPLVLPLVLQFGPPGRSAAGFAVRLFRLFDTTSLGKNAALKAAKAIEDKLVAANALLHCPETREPAPLRHAIPSNTDILVLLHGTGSNTAGSFGALAPAHWDLLRARFAGDDGIPHIYGFEHRTLTQNPVQNAIDLLEQLPENARLHLLSHSRGGIIGELLARAHRQDGVDPFDKIDFQMLQLARGSSDAAKVEHDQLVRLNALLKEKRPTIKSFLRVACPASGTILASERLDLYLSVIANLINLVPGPQRPFFGVFRNFVQAVVASRTNPAAIPGLEAMMPEGPLVAMLNRSDLAITSPLSVIGGDRAPGGNLKALAVIATDLFFREDHDLVVNTDAMLGGTPRAKGVSSRVLLDRGTQVSHFSYFSNQGTADPMVRALTDGSDIGDPVDPVPSHTAVPFRPRSAAQDDRPIALIIPAHMATHLGKNGQRVWMDPLRITLGDITRIGCNSKAQLATGVVPMGVIDTYYRSLMQDLSRTHEVVPFPYDWRLSMLSEADRLGDVVRALLDKGKTPIRIVAHGAGGLIARSFIARHRNLWQKMINDRPGSRLLMLGTPNHGSASAAAALLGLDEQVRQLAQRDLKNDLAQVIAALMPCPGMLEQLPTDSSFAFYDATTWQALRPVAPKGWAPPKQAWLDAARASHEALRDALLDHPDDTDHMLYLAGQGDATVAAIDSDTPLATTQGDGRVTWRAGQLPGLRTWFAPNTEHGDLVRDPALFPPITDLLLQGTTDDLPTAPSPDATPLFDMAKPPTLHPSPRDAMLTVLGGKADLLSEARTRAEAETRIQVRLGDLRYEDQTIAVGHYENAPLVHAERALDIALDGRLARHRELDLYPGALMSGHVFFRAAPGVGPQAALVVGLGTFGQISQKALTATLAQAFLRFALRWRERDADAPCRLATLLIGQRGGRLTIAASLRAIVDALAHCNQRLPSEDRIRDLTILELFEDKAIEAVEALRRLSAQLQLPEHIIASDQLAIGRGGRRRSGPQTPQDWEHKIAINAKDDAGDQLEFQSLSDAAAIERHALPLNKARVDRLIADGTASTGGGGDVGPLMFEWMLPRALKPVISDGRNLTLVLDAQAAQYPWELLEDKWLQTGQPVCVSANILRQLRDAKYLDRPMPAASKRVLVVGDPLSDFVKLPGAAREAQLVAAQFQRHGWAEADLTCLTGQTGHRISAELSLQDTQILHFAGHGLRDHGPEKITGLVLGPGDILQPSYIRNLRRIPELVFLNCCHVGAIAPADKDATPSLCHDRAGFAASLAMEFIRCGASAVIAAGWEVDDTAAQLLADTFYAELLGGAPFGEAVRAARHRTWSTHPERNTWGAYQCYGDPQFRLRRGRGGFQPRARTRTYTTASQAVVAAENLSFEANAMRRAFEQRSVTNQYQALFAQITGHRAWHNDPQLLEALATLAADLGDNATAISYCEKAFQAEPATYGASLVEMYLELKIRNATDDAREGAIDQMIAHLTARFAAPGLAPSPRALVKTGECHLRLAAHLIATPDRSKDYKTALLKAQTAFETARDSARPNSATAATATAQIRSVFVTYVLARDCPDAKMAAPSEIAFNSASEVGDNTPTPDFESRRVLAETRLLRLVLDDEPTATAREQVLRAFENAFTSGSSLRGRKATVDDLRVTATLLAERDAKASKLISGLADSLDIYAASVLSQGSGRG